MVNDDRPNILFVFADQMHGFAMGCMGNVDVHTPNLDQMADDGVLFTNTYSSAPVCTPYRGALFTGKYRSQTKVNDNGKALPDNYPTLADRLNDGGYRTSYVGKWHLGGAGNIAVEPEFRGGFQDFIGYQCYNDYLQNVSFFDEDGEKQSFHKHRTDATTDVAIERLRGLGDDPFAMFISYQNPHYPVQPSKQYDDLYKGKNITKRPNTIDIDPYTVTYSPPTPNKELDMNYLRYGNDLDEYLRLYYAMITQLDANIGRLMAELEALGLAENTIVMFTSDHGDMQGSHGLINKCTFYEESTRVPFIVKVPSGLTGITKEEVISTVDLYPTILDYCSLSVADDMEGDSFAPMTTGQEQIWKDEAFSEDRDWYMYRKGSHKLVICTETLEPTHFFDLEKDPYEMNNLVDHDHPEKEEMKLRLEMRYTSMVE